MVIVLYEAVHSYRQIFTDGRELPKDPNPTWQGYSIGHWEGNDFVAQTSGFNNQGWLDNDGRPATDALSPRPGRRATRCQHAYCTLGQDDRRTPNVSV